MEICNCKCKEGRFANCDVIFEGGVKYLWRNVTRGVGGRFLPKIVWRHLWTAPYDFKITNLNTTLKSNLQSWCGTPESFSCFEVKIESSYIYFGFYQPKNYVYELLYLQNSPATETSRTLFLNLLHSAVFRFNCTSKQASLNNFLCKILAQ